MPKCRSSSICTPACIRSHRSISIRSPYGSVCILQSKSTNLVDSSHERAQTYAFLDSLKLRERAAFLFGRCLNVFLLLRDFYGREMVATSLGCEDAANCQQTAKKYVSVISQRLLRCKQTSCMIFLSVMRARVLQVGWHLQLGVLRTQKCGHCTLKLFSFRWD